MDYDRMKWLQVPGMSPKKQWALRLVTVKGSALIRCKFFSIITLAPGATHGRDGRRSSFSGSYPEDLHPSIWSEQLSAKASALELVVMPSGRVENRRLRTSYIETCWGALDSSF